METRIQERKTRKDAQNQSDNPQAPTTQGSLIIKKQFSKDQVYIIYKFKFIEGTTSGAPLKQLQKSVDVVDDDDEEEKAGLLAKQKLLTRVNAVDSGNYNSPSAALKINLEDQVKMLLNLVK